MNRSKTLRFQTFELFRLWYAEIKKRFNTLVLRYVRFNTLAKGVWCTIVY